MDPVQIYWKERKAKLSPEISSKLDDLEEKGHMTDELILFSAKGLNFKKVMFLLYNQEKIFISMG